MGSGLGLGLGSGLGLGLGSGLGLGLGLDHLEAGGCVRQLVADLGARLRDRGVAGELRGAQISELEVAPLHHDLGVGG